MQSELDRKLIIAQMSGFALLQNEIDIIREKEESGRRDHLVMKTLDNIDEAARLLFKKLEWELYNDLIPR